MRLTERWNAFWFVPFSTRLLAFFRIVLCLLILLEVARSGMMASFLSGNESRYFANGFYAPYFSFLRPPSYPVYLVLTRIFIFCAFTAMIGFFTRASFFLTAGVFFYLFFLNKFFFQNHFYSLGLVLFLSTFMPCAETWSCDARLKQFKNGGNPPDFVISWAARLVQVTVSIMYLASATSKLTPAWISGGVFKIFYENGVLDPGKAFALIGRIPYAWQAVLALATEYFLAFGLWWRKTRFLAFVVGIFFHTFLNFSMEIGQFSFQIFAYYLLFLNPLPRNMKQTPTTFQAAH